MRLVLNGERQYIKKNQKINERLKRWLGCNIPSHEVDKIRMARILYEVRDKYTEPLEQIYSYQTTLIAIVHKERELHDILGFIVSKGNSNDICGSRSEGADGNQFCGRRFIDSDRLKGRIDVFKVERPLCWIEVIRVQEDESWET